MSYQRHSRKEFWINLFITMKEKLGIDYDSLRSKDVNEFFFFMKEFEKKIKSE